MSVQLNHIVPIHMAATIWTGLMPLAVYFASGKRFVRGTAAGAVKGGPSWPDPRQRAALPVLSRGPGR